MIGPARVHLPASARPGEVVQVRTLISHPMENGYRIGTDSRRIPRNIIDRFRCSYAGRVLIDAEFGPAIAANPYLAFEFVADRSGEVLLEWFEDTGAVHREHRQLEVTAS